MRASDRPIPPLAEAADPADLVPGWPLYPTVAISGLRSIAVWDDPANVYDPGYTPSSRVGTAIVGMARVGNTAVA